MNLVNSYTEIRWISEQFLNDWINKRKIFNKKIACKILLFFHFVARNNKDSFRKLSFIDSWYYDIFH